jgi:hypothetical protein
MFNILEDLNIVSNWFVPIKMKDLLIIHTAASDAAPDAAACFSS